MISDEQKLALTAAEMKNEWEGYPAANLIDGNLDNFAHTYAVSDGMWIRVTLPSYSSVSRIVVYNREHSCCKGRIIGMSVYIKYNELITATCGNITTEALVYDYDSCSGEGNVVELSQEGEVGAQNIAEIEVYGVATDEPAIDFESGM